MKYKFKITGLDCPNCAMKLAASFEKLDSVESAKINFLTEKLTVESVKEPEALVAELSQVARKFDSSVKVEA